MAAGAYQRADGMWVYRKVRARALWEEIMDPPTTTASPAYCSSTRQPRQQSLLLRTIEATNPCAEQPLPSYGCCCLGSIDLTRFVDAPFTQSARFDFDGLRALVATAVRMLDNVLDATVWPLPKQQEEARAKRRIGLGFMAWAMRW